MGGQLKISLSSFLLIFALLLVCVDDDVYCGWSGRASGLVINAHELILVSWESWFRLHPDILSLSHFNLRHYLHDQALQGSLATTLRQLEYNFLYNFVATVRQLWDNFKTIMGNFLRQILATFRQLGATWWLLLTVFASALWTASSHSNKISYFRFYFC